uniref:LRRNT domain-containing protein n=1 Tax=Chelonoidis abingdonii TaxID=106734 RepID=A0A8C0GUU9_CHEAB
MLPWLIPGGPRLLPSYYGFPTLANSWHRCYLKAVPVRMAMAPTSECAIVHWGRHPPALVAACPSMCKCSPEDTIRCNKAGLRTLPAELATSTVSLNLSNNLLRILTANTFRNLTFLRSLWLDRNNLTFLYPGTFSALSNLRELDLGWNSRLTHLHANTFRGLSNLISLDLASCNIFEIHPLVFSYLLSLQVLDLTSNNLSHQRFLLDMCVKISCGCAWRLNMLTK